MQTSSTSYSCTAEPAISLHSRLLLEGNWCGNPTNESTEKAHIVRKRLCPDACATSSIRQDKQRAADQFYSDL